VGNALTLFMGKNVYAYSINYKNGNVVVVPMALIKIPLEELTAR
jgi:hypothetical protein